MKLRFDSRYIHPMNMDAIVLSIYIPRKVLVEAIPTYSSRNPIDTQVLINILERSEYEPLPEGI